MRKYLFILGAAAMVFASCTKQQVTSVAENRVISFDSYVYNGVSSKAVTELTAKTGLKSYYLFGSLGDASKNYTAPVFTNEPNTTVAYWTADKFYQFAAYADGEGGKLDAVAFDATNKTLKFTGYTPNDAKDLVAAVPNEVQAPKVLTTVSPVALTFKHMLSQVKFTFKTQAADGYTIEVNTIKVNAIKTADATFDGTNVVWTAGSNPTADYNFTTITDVAVAANNNVAATDSKLIIPQDTQKLTVSFTASITGPGMAAPVTKSFTATLSYSGASGTAWMPGYRYNYTADINPENIIDQMKPIQFNATVEDWTDATGQNTTPAPVK